MAGNSTIDCDPGSGEPPNPERDKFKVPFPRKHSAFTTVNPKYTCPDFDNRQKMRAEEIQGKLYELYKNNLLRHPLIVELIKQAKEQNFPMSSFYIPIELLTNYQYYTNEEIPILYNSKET